MPAADLGSRGAATPKKKPNAPGFDPQHLVPDTSSQTAADVRSMSPTSATGDPTPPAELGSRDPEQLAFCCETPDLQWTGEPDSAGVACLNCGYVVAQVGRRRGPAGGRRGGASTGA